MWLIPWSGRRDDARWDEIGRCREEREEKIKDFCSDDRRSDRFAGWCGRLARTGHARGISTGLREFRRSFAQEFHLGRNALGEYRERPVIARHSWPSTRCHRPRQPRGKRQTEEDVDFNATVSVSVSEYHGERATCLPPVARRTWDPSLYDPFTTSLRRSFNGEEGEGGGGEE